MKKKFTKKQSKLVNKKYAYILLEYAYQHATISNDYENYRYFVMQSWRKYIFFNFNVVFYIGLFFPRIIFYFLKEYHRRRSA